MVTAIHEHSSSMEHKRDQSNWFLEPKSGPEIISSRVHFERPRVDDNEGDSYSTTQNPDTIEGNIPLEPYEGMEFETEEAAKVFYNSYARYTGFSTRVNSSRRSRRDGTVISWQLVCAKEGFRVKKNENIGQVKRSRAITRVGCKAMITVKKQDDCEKWVVTKLIKDHNHELENPEKVHCLRSHRHISGTAKSLIHTLQGAGVGPSGIMSVLIKESGGVNNVGFTERDCRNYIRSVRQKTLENDAKDVLGYLRRMQDENPDFFYSIQGDDPQSTSNVFWVDSRSKMNYSYFGDAVTFDTTYRTNRYRMPFAPFTGVNHHGQPVLFGCTILFDESEASFTWLFETWLTAMSGRHPVSITTDHDRTIRSAIIQVFPNTRHRFCKWHILRKSQAKLSQVYHIFPTFQSEFHRCINLTETVDEFETSWEILLDKYNLRENEWLQSLYGARLQWVPVYLRDTFFAELSPIQVSEVINSFFDGYVNSQTTVQGFVSQYEKALKHRYKKEVKADLDTITNSPVLKTPSPMEKQASSIYTKKIFEKFQEELVETLVYTANKVEEDGSITVYKVTKFDIDNKSYNVSFNFYEMRARCSCEMFEYSGILCRHILTVFRVRNVLTIPSHYILKRWTRNAKSKAILDEQVTESLSTISTHESLTVRYNNLSYEATKYVEAGAVSVDTYIVAISALREAMAKVLGTKRNGANSQFHSGNQTNDIGTYHANALLSHSPDDKDKLIRELTHDLVRANRRCESYRTHLLAFMKEIEEHEQNLSIKIRMREIESKELDDQHCRP